TYIFKHALIQDAAYASLLKSTRQLYHQRIAQVLEEQFVELVATQPELLAHHYTEAGLIAQAVDYWQKAGQSAVQRSAHMETISQLGTGLALLQTLPELPERTQREVDLLIVLGAALRATKGIAALEVGETYTRARHLCQHLAEPQQLFPILGGLCLYHGARAELQTAHALSTQLLDLAQHTQDPVMLVAAHRAVGTAFFYLGVVASAHTHFTQALALYDRHQHQAATVLYEELTGVTCCSYAALTLWSLGYPDQGLTRSHEALRLAQQMPHPHSLAIAVSFAAFWHALRREVRAAQEHATAAISLATKQGFALWRAFGTMFHGWTLAQQRQAQAG